MNGANSIISQLNPQYFWDVDFSGLDLNSSSRLIIERIFTLGETHEMKLLITYYGRKKVINTLCILPYIDQKTLNFVSKLFKKPVKLFRCYQLKQSKPQHWNT